MNNKLVITTLLCSVLYGCGSDNTAEVDSVESNPVTTSTQPAKSAKLIDRAEIDQIIRKHTKTFMALPGRCAVSGDVREERRTPEPSRGAPCCVPLTAWARAALGGILLRTSTGRRVRSPAWKEEAIAYRRPLRRAHVSRAPTLLLR